MQTNREITGRPFPRIFERALENLLKDDEADQDELLNLSWEGLRLEDLERPFELPACPASFASIAEFVKTEMRSQVEIIRNDISTKVNRLCRNPKEDEKHLRFPLPGVQSSLREGHELKVNFSSIHKVPPRGQFSNYVVVFQQLVPSNGQEAGDVMKNLTLAYCKQLRKKDGAIFRLGSDAAALESLDANAIVYVRVILTFSMRKTHIRAIRALCQAEDELNDSFLAKQLLRGHIETSDMQTREKLDKWIHFKSEMDQSGSSSDNISEFNQQQQRALALEALTEKGLVIIQGPPGTGKSHSICHGILPQLADRKEKVLVVCNSNVAVDALMLKCTKIDSLKGMLLRCGFKQNVSEEIVSMGLYAEGDLESADMDASGNRPGSNSNTSDGQVQKQICSAKIVFTTIHFASKEKDICKTESYWNFDAMVLDEAAQIEDSKVFIVLARCPSLKKMVLVGDPKQLQPYVPRSLRKQGYGKSTMERLMEKADREVSREDETIGLSPYVMLEEQFRMAPPLRQIVSNLYYGGRLKDGRIVNGRGPVESVKLQSLLVVNLTESPMTFSRLHQSYENKGEAMIVKLLCDYLLSSEFNRVLPEGVDDITPQDICILTPYNRHKDRLRMLVCDIDEENLDEYGGLTFRRENNTAGSPSKAQVLCGTQDAVDEGLAAMLENIDTVDKFQGSERKIVVISTCVDRKPLRAADPHFINVACSRAQHLLVIVGNFSSGLKSSEDWKYVHQQAQENGSYLAHTVTARPGAGEDGDTLLDVHQEEFNAKLQDLLGPPSQKQRATA